MTQSKLPVLSDEQKLWIANACASTMSFAEISACFWEVYPEYASELAKDDFLKQFHQYLANLLNQPSSRTKFIAELKASGIVDIDPGTIPITQQGMRDLYYQQLWNLVKGYLDTHLADKDPKKVDYSEVIKEPVRDLLAILRGAQKTASEMDQKSVEARLTERDVDEPEFIAAVDLFAPPGSTQSSDARSDHSPETS